MKGEIYMGKRKKYRKWKKRYWAGSIKKTWKRYKKNRAKWKNPAYRAKIEKRYKRQGKKEW